MLITFSGVDGCGKTTFAEQVLSLFKKPELLRPTDAALSRKIGNLIGSVSKNGAKSVAVSSRGGINFVRKLSLLVDASAFRLTAFIAGLRGQAIVCDRYFFDSLVHLNYLGVSTNSFQGLLLFIAPKPDIAFFISVNPRVAAKRDKEFSPEFYFGKQAIYESLFARVKHVKLTNENRAPALKKMRAAVLNLIEGEK